MTKSVKPLPEGYGLTQCGDLQLPFNANTTWDKSRGFIYEDDPLTESEDRHEGVDWVTFTGTPVRAMVSGNVMRIERGYTLGDSPRPADVPALGNFVIVQTGGFGDLPTVGFEHTYAHLAEVHVFEGQPVATGDLLGVSGDTGHSTGPHLHVDVRPFGTKAADAENSHGKTFWNGETATRHDLINLYSGCVDFEECFPDVEN